MLISDRKRMGPDPVETAARKLRELSPGAALQWREKDQSPAEVFRSLTRLQQLLDSGGSSQPLLPAPVFVNDRVDIALALGLHVHLTETSLPTRIVRGLLRADRLVGRSVHSMDAALEAEDEGADYVLFGPIFATPSKRAFGKPQGLDALATLSDRLHIPVVAVGGIRPPNLTEVFAAGAAAWAAIAAAWDGPEVS